jgi:hypothetical protein
MQDHGWLRAFRRYLGATALANLLWEFAQMPLYTVWQASWAEIAFAGLHCLGGDLLIASASILAALITLNAERWPEKRFGVVAATTMSLGLGYTAFSEWLNVSVRQSWAYSDMMPTVTPLEIGVSPLIQWIVVPALAFFIARPPCRAERSSSQ